MFKSRVYKIWFAIMLIASIVMAFVPLFDLLAFEFCAIMALLISFASAQISTQSTFWRSFGSSISLLILPLIVILLNAFRIENCNFREGFLFFLILPMISCFYGVSAGQFFGAIFTKRPFFGFCIYVSMTYILLLKNLIFEPTVFGFHSTFGYFPGPIYDEKIHISSSLLIARATTILIGLIFWELKNSVVEASPLRFYEIFKRPILLILLLIFAIIWTFRGELGLRSDRKFIERKLDFHFGSEHFEFFIERDSISAKEINKIIDDHEFRYNQLSKLLQTKADRKIRSYIYATPKLKKRLMGAEETSLQDLFGYGFHVNYEKFPHSIIKHEMVHVLTSEWQFLPISLKLGLHEGIAVTADWDAGDLTPHQWSKAMRDLGILPSIRKIMGFGFWLSAGSRNYMVAGSFVRFLIDTHGLEKFKRVFGFGNFKKIYGKELAELESEWIDFLDEISLTENDLRITKHRFRRRGIFGKKCAHEIAKLRDLAWKSYRNGNFTIAITHFNEIISHNENDLNALRGSMFSFYRLSKSDLTSQFANQIITSDKSSIYFVAEAKNLLGDLAWKRDQIETAESLFSDVFDLHASKNFDRESKAKLAVLRRDPKFRSVFIDDLSPRQKMTFLHELAELDPNFGLTFYLIGRQLHFDRAFADVTRYLERAKKLGLSDQSLEIECLRLIAMNNFEIENFELSISNFREMLTFEEISDGSKNEINDWIARCEWFNKK